MTATATHTPAPLTHVYKEINEGKYRTVKHFELQEVKNGKPQLKRIVQLAQNRSFAKSKPYYWFTQHDGKKWQKPFITGLFLTKVKNVYNGDVNHKSNLLLFEIDEFSKTLTVHYYKDYFTHNLSPLLNQFNK